MLSKIKYFFKNIFILTTLQFRWFFFKRFFSAKTASSNEPELIISLASYLPRFKTLDLTLKSLLLQSHPADRLIVWIPESDLPYLPSKVVNLKAYGVTVQPSEDLRSYSKLIHALEKFQDSLIVTADDDIYYWRNWLRDLIKTPRDNPQQIICHRMHLIQLSEDGQPLPYQEWKHCHRSPAAHVLHFPTGCGGVLYPPHVFFPKVLDKKSFLEICPTADDVWFYSMARMGGATFKRTKTWQQIHCWNDSQEIGLFTTNVTHGKNDEQIKKMLERYPLFS